MGVLQLGVMVEVLLLSRSSWLASLSVVVHSQLSYRIWFESCGYSDGAQNQEMRRNISELGATSSVTDPSRAALRSSVLRERRKNSECIHTFVS